MGSATNRNLYFEREIRMQPTPDLYMKALHDSPYRTHRRMAVALYGMYKGISEEVDKFSIPEIPVENS